MRFRTALGTTALGATAALILHGAAIAQPVNGLYVGAGAGANFMQTEKNENDSRITTPFFSGDFVGHRSLHFDPGFVGVGSLGFGFGNGLRVEAEGDYRQNDLQGRSNGEEKFGGMGNLLFDLDIGSRYIYPYMGAGAGYMRINRAFAGHQDGSFAYQGIAGAAFPLPWVTGLSATFEYRIMGLASNRQSERIPGASYTQTFTNDLNHDLLVGLRYAFNTPPPPAPVAEPAPVPAVVPARTYLVFFDWDRADLSDRARQIIAEAAQNSTRVQTTRIEVQGNADRSGTPAYNQRLSVRRAQTVAAELVHDGVPQNTIDIQGFGDTRPLVPTAAGVREPQNRRVAIILR